MPLLIATLLILLYCCWCVNANEDAKRLYDDLFRDYNRHKRPASSPIHPISVKLKMRLSQIVDLNEIDQIMTSSVWMHQEWVDMRLAWDVRHYGGLKIIYVPHELIWTPDLTLYNNADTYKVFISTKAALHHSGRITWTPPAIFRSFCQINEVSILDEQLCHLKFGSWSYSEDLLDLRLLGAASNSDDNSTVEEGIKGDIVVEWDVMSRRAQRSSKRYFGPASLGARSKYVDIAFYLRLRRKPLFYSVNLVFPCVGISFLTVLVFYLPSDSGEKISLCVSILVALTIFFLLLVEIIPATSTSIPLIGKYLLFTMMSVSTSILVSVISLNLHFRKPTTHSMGEWTRRVFLDWLPKLLFMRRPDLSTLETTVERNQPVLLLGGDKMSRRMSRDIIKLLEQAPSDERLRQLFYTPSVVKAFVSVVGWSGVKCTEFRRTFASFQQCCGPKPAIPKWKRIGSI